MTYKTQSEALRLAAQLEDTEGARLHLLPYAAAELRRLHAEVEALRELEEREQRDEALLRQALKALEYYRSGEDYQPTPASEAITAIKERLK